MLLVNVHMNVSFHWVVHSAYLIHGGQKQMTQSVLSTFVPIKLIAVKEHLVYSSSSTISQFTCLSVYPYLDKGIKYTYDHFLISLTIRETNCLENIKRDCQISICFMSIAHFSCKIYINAHQHKSTNSLKNNDYHIASNITD